MVVSSEVAGLAMSVVSGSIKLGKKLDEMMAAQVADSSPLSLPFTDVAGAPEIGDLEDALRAFLARAPDLSAADRGQVEAALEAGVRSRLTRQCEKHGLMEEISIEIWSPDAEFQEALRRRAPAWDLDEEDVKRATYYLAAGPSRRRDSLGFRIAATVLDVATEVLGQNVRHLTDHRPTQELVGAILVRFSEPDLETMDGWGQVLEHALRSTLNVVLDQREQVATNSEWVRRVLSALARTRERSGDDFVVGLLRGTGVQNLLRSALEEGSDFLSEGDGEVWENMLADVLAKAAETIQPASTFETWFQENWNVMVGAGLGAVAEHGPVLVGDEKLLSAVLEASIGAVADAFHQGPPGPEVLDAAVRAAVGVFEDPALLEGEVPEEWLRQLIASTAQVLTDETEDGLRGAFSRGALERYARNTLSVLSRYPEVLAKDSAIVQGLLKDVLGKMAAVETFGVMPLADIAVEGALAAFADNPELVDTRYAEVLGQLAGELAKQVAQNGLSGLQAEDLLESVSVTIATNDELFVQARSGLADAIVGAVLKAANGDERGLLAGSALVAAIQGSLDVVAGFGLGLPANMDQVRKRVHDVVAEALVLAADRLGKGLAQSDLPDLVVELVAQLARGELPAIGSDEFAAVFDGFLN